MVYPHKWSAISCKSSAGQGKFAGERPMFCHCATQPTEAVALAVVFVEFCSCQDASDNVAKCTGQSEPVIQ